MDKDCAIVTGAGRGIGRAIALALGEAGFAVVVNYARSADEAERTAHDIRSRGGTAVTVQANVAEFDEAAALVKAAVLEFGGVYALVNNAGITRDGLIMRMSEKDFDDVIATNLKGAFNCTRYASANMVKNHRGRIVNIAPVAGIVGNAGQANYAASKAGMVALTKSLSKEVARRGITVNCVSPGFIDTDLIRDLPEDQAKRYKQLVPVRRFGKPQEIADAILFLASRESAYITGSVLEVTGGL